MKKSRCLALFALILLPFTIWGQTITVAGLSPDTNGDFTDESGTKITSGTVSFDSSTNTLTLDNASISGNIESDISPLTVHLVGSNNILPNNDYDAPFKFTGTDTSTSHILIFESTEEENGEITFSGAISVGASNTDRTLQMGPLGGYDARYIDNQDYSYFQTPDADVKGKYKYWVIEGSSNGNSYLYRVFYNPHYDITINNYEVTRLNKDNVLRENLIYGATPTVVFDPTNKTLTLSNANITTDINGTNVIESGLDNLTVYLVGSNTINCQYDNDCVFKGTTAGAKVVFATDATTPGLLNVSVNQESNLFADITPEYQGLSYTREGVDFTISAIDYGIIIGGVAITSACVGSDGTISGVPSITSGTVQFDPSGNKLTLNNAKLENNIAWCNDADLTIDLIGSNSITSDGSCLLTEYKRKISFKRGDANNDCSLELSGEEGNHVIGSNFSNYTEPTLTGLYWLPTIDDKGALSHVTITSSFLGGGDGTEESPYLIKTYDDLKDFATYVNNGTLTTKCVKLADDLENGILDCSGMTGFEPIGNGSKQFEGTFDGNGKTISNLSMTNVNSQDVGLFGYNDGTIKNLTLSSCTISGGSSSSPSYIGALAGQNAGSISGCTVKECTVSCNEDSSNPYVGGIVGILHGSITNCVVENTSVNAVTSDVSASDPPAYAGGIAGSRSNDTISGCTVKGTTTVTADYSNCSTNVFAGAIVGILQGEGTFTDNTYESTVTTKAKKQGDSDYTTKSGQTQRGIGNGNDEIGKVELAGTKKVRVFVPDVIGFVSCTVVEGSYYLFKSDYYYALPGYDFTFSVTPNAGYKPVLTLNNESIELTVTEKTANDAYDHTEFTFTMPDADLEATLAFPIDLAAISPVNFSIDNGNYTGEAVEPTTVQVTGVPGATGVTVLTKGTHFTIKGYKLNGQSVTSPVETGTYTVTIEGMGEYIGTQDVSYEIIKAYALKINGTQLNAKNIDDFYGNGTVKFTPATETEPTNTLTLNGASVTGTIESGLGNLTIKLIGSNTIQGNGSSLITSLNGGTLTFDSDGTTISLLEFKNASGNVFPNDPISGFAEVKYGWVEYVESEGSKKVCSWDIEILKNGTSYRIYDGNKDHILGEGDESVKYSHDATNGHVITLNNAEVNCIWTDIHADITIALNGTNRVIDTGGTYAIYSNNGKINFVKAEGAASVELTATCGNGYVPIKYGSITLGEGLYWKPFYADANATVKSTVITDDPEFIIIENYVMTDDRSIETAITYDSTEKILTFNQYAGALTSQIKTGVQGLTIKLKGTSTVAAGSLDYPFKAMTNTASILFDGENDSETGSLVMETNSDSAPFEGFAEGAITYNKVVYSRDDGGNNIHTIKAPTAPAMSLDNEKVKLTKDYDDGTIYYSIAYADDTPSETGVKYSEPFAITHPGVVTAWVEANNATTSTVTGKHFAYQDAPYTMAINGIKTPTLLPTIAEGDVISLQRYASEDEDIASFIDGLITAKKPGTVTLSAILMPGDNTPFKVLNPLSETNKHTVSFKVYVGEPLSNYFEGSNEFCTFYNEDSEIYAVPQGMKAYVVTGIDGNCVTMEETTVLPPNTVVLLEKADGIAFTKDPSEGAAPGGNLLKHATAEVPVTSESCLYVLFNDTFVKATAGSRIPSGKNYLDLSSNLNAMNSAGARGFYEIGDSDTTGIHSMVNSQWSMTNDEWFDLQGRRIQKPTKPGLYIKNGKKVVVINK